jgi:hypothetical protein
LCTHADWTWAIRLYKTVVKHSLVCELEVLFANFCDPVLGLENVCGNNEFSKKLSAIHIHILDHTASSVYSLIGKVMAEWALTAMQHLVAHNDTTNSVRGNDGNIDITAQATIDATFQSAL